MHRCFLHWIAITFITRASSSSSCATPLPGWLQVTRDLLPKMLIKAGRDDLVAFFRAITTRHFDDIDVLFEPAAFIALLHRADMAAAVPLRHLIAAVDVAVQHRDKDAATGAPTGAPLFSPTVLLTALRKLEEMSPLPKMFMRTVIQVLKAHGRLRADILSLLLRLLGKQASAGPPWRGHGRPGAHAGTQAQACRHACVIADVHMCRPSMRMRADENERLSMCGDDMH